MDKEELEFDRLLADKRHKEMVKCLTDIAKDNNEAIKSIAEKLSVTEEPEIKLIGESIINKLDEMIKRKMVLTIERDRNGDMKTITVETINNN